MLTVIEPGVVIGQMECSSEKTNEIPIAERLIQILKIKGVIITADALLCQKEIVKKIAKDNDAGKKTLNTPPKLRSTKNIIINFNVDIIFFKTINSL